jgi:hypothetical protein
MFCIDENIDDFEFSNTHEMYLTPRFCVASPLNGYPDREKNTTRHGYLGDYCGIWICIASSKTPQR